MKIFKNLIKKYYNKDNVNLNNKLFNRNSKIMLSLIIKKMMVGVLGNDFFKLSKIQNHSCYDFLPAFGLPSFSFLATPPSRIITSLKI